MSYSCVVLNYALPVINNSYGCVVTQSVEVIDDE